MIRISVGVDAVVRLTSTDKCHARWVLYRRRRKGMGYGAYTWCSLVGFKVTTAVTIQNKVACDAVYVIQSKFMDV
jgi:hypothetical protein